MRKNLFIFLLLLLTSLLPCFLTGCSINELDAIIDTYSFWICVCALIVVAFTIALIVCVIKNKDLFEPLLDFYIPMFKSRITHVFLILYAVLELYLFIWNDHILGIIFLITPFAIIIMSIFVDVIYSLLFIFSTPKQHQANSNNNQLKIDDYIYDKSELANKFTVQELKSYCKRHKIKKYNSLNKEQLVDLVFNAVEYCKYDRESLNHMSVPALKAYCKRTKIRGYYSSNKSEVIQLILDNSLGDIKSDSKASND